MQAISGKQIIQTALMSVAQEMVIAAETAPKGCGENNMVSVILEEGAIQQISQKLNGMAKKYESPVFARDAENILSAPVMVLLGSKIKSLGLKKCGMCGMANCDEKNKPPEIPCVFNTGDLGIAIGSAVSVAMDRRVDNRIMYTVGQAALDMGILGPEVKIAYGIPLSATSKNPFFDRKT